jgi:hypothetical protein
MASALAVLQGRRYSGGVLPHALVFAVALSGLLALTSCVKVPSAQVCAGVTSPGLGRTGDDPSGTRTPAQAYGSVCVDLAAR